jgi:hypothetical protein
VCVHATGEADEPVDRREREHERQRVLPGRHADERAPCRKHERRAEREDGEEPRNGSLGICAESHVAGEEDGDERVRDGLPRRLGVLLARGECARNRIGDGIQREPEDEPGQHERDVTSQRGRSVEGAGDEQRGRETRNQRELRNAE